MQQSFNVPSLLLAQLLFPNPQISPAVSDAIKQAARQGAIRATEGQINEFFEQVGRQKPEIYWLLLKGEARENGMAVSRDDAGRVLQAVIPQLTQNQITAEQLLSSIVRNQNIEAEVALQTYADLLSVERYLATVTQNQAVTMDQIKFDVLAQMQTLDANVVVFSADDMVKKASEPEEAKLTELFEQYKDVFARDFSSENPYGFGYKQPARVKIEYALLDMEDVEKLIPAPTPEQTENFYQQNISQFKYQVPEDPNDPNSKQIEKTRTYAEVASDIREQLFRTRVNERGQNILNEVREIADSNLLTVDVEKLSMEEAAKLAGSYEQAAREVSARHNVNIATGTTGFITANDIEQNQILGRLNLAAGGRMATRLPEIAFAVSGLDVVKLGPFEPVKPRPWESIGVLTDYMQQSAAIVRVVDFKKAHEPENISVAFPKRLPVDVNGTITESNDVYVLKTFVADDAKKLSVLAIAKQAASALLKAVPEKGWDEALADINKEFGTSEDSNEATFSIQPLSGIRRISEENIQLIKRQAAEEPGREGMAGMYQAQKELINKLFELIPADKAQAGNLPQVIEHKAGMAYYVVKTLSQTLVTDEQLDQIRGQVAIMNELVNSQTMGLELLMPDNIINRLNFKWDEQKAAMPVEQEQIPTGDVI